MVFIILKLPIYSLRTGLIIKSDLEGRPVYVWIEEHIKANFLNCRFKDSIVLVVYIIFLIGSENWKNGQIASQFSYQVLNADE